MTGSASNPLRHSGARGARTRTDTTLDCFACAGNDGENYRPVFTRVQSRLMTRWVAGSRAVITNSFASVACVRIDGLVVEDLGIDQLLARQIAVGIGQEIGILGRDLGPIEIVDQLIGLGDMACIGRDRQIVEKHLRALFRDGIADLDAVLGLGGTAARLHDVAGPAHHQANLAGGERAQIFRGMKLADIGPDLGDEIGGLFQIGRLGRIRIEPEIVQRRREEYRRRNPACERRNP